MRGISESAGFNAAMVLVKLAIGLFVAMGAFQVKPEIGRSWPVKMLV
jgi:hypothetical protein